MSWIANRPQDYADLVVGTGHCVAFAQRCALVPHTSRWVRGVKVRGKKIARGTAIATFAPNGRYGNRVDGRSHAAIFIKESDVGLEVWDQWRGQPVHRRTIRFRGGEGSSANDGDAYHVIEEAEV